MTYKPITTWQIDGKKWKQCQISFSWTPKSLWMVTAAMKLWHLLFRWKAMTNIDRVHHFAITGSYSQSYGFSSSHVWMWDLDHKECWELKNWSFWTVVLGETLKSPLDSKEIKPFNLKGNQLWVFIGRTGAEAEAPVFWRPDVKNWFIGKDPDAEKDWRQEGKGATEDEMVGWHHDSLDMSLSKLRGTVKHREI